VRRWTGSSTTRRTSSLGSTPLTAAFLGARDIDAVLAAGKAHAARLHFEDVDDVACIGLGLFEDFGTNFTNVVRRQRGPSTMLKRAILRSAAEGARK
jgi:hypothetical protein